MYNILNIYAYKICFNIDLLFSYQTYAISLKNIFQVSPGFQFNKNKVTQYLNFIKYKFLTEERVNIEKLKQNILGVFFTYAHTHIFFELVIFFIHFTCFGFLLFMLLQLP